MSEPLTGSRFSLERFVHTEDRARLCQQLEQVLTDRLRSARAPDEEGYQIVRDLRTLGHDLWSFDESTDFQHGCGNWHKPTHPYELIVEISYREDKPRTVSVSFKDRGREGSKE